MGDVIDDALKVEDLTASITVDAFERKISEKELFTIISSMRDSRLESIQECVTAKEVWNKVQQRCAGKIMIKKLGLLNNIMIGRSKQARLWLSCRQAGISIFTTCVSVICRRRCDKGCHTHFITNKMQWMCFNSFIGKYHARRSGDKETC